MKLSLLGLAMGLASQAALAATSAPPLQDKQAFIDHDALQCGYCTPGMIMNAAGLLLRNASPTREEIIDGMEDNLCRCGAHTRIIDAIEEAAQKIKK